MVFTTVGGARRFRWLAHRPAGIDFPQVAGMVG